MLTRNIELKQVKKKKKHDKQRIFRVVEYLDYGEVFVNLPVEIVEGFILSDIDNYEVFASFVFRNVSRKGIKSLDVRLHLFHNQNIPYIKIPFRYSYETYSLGIRRENEEEIRVKKMLRPSTINAAESFGEAVYIPIPESYFTRFELEIKGIEYEDGTYDKLDTILGKKAVNFKDFNEHMRYVYSKINIYTYAEERFPVKNLPQKGEFAWMCCCGHKNPDKFDLCSRCLRERDWQLENIAEDKLEETTNKILEEESVYFKPDKSHYSQKKYLETEEDIKRKAEAYQSALKVVAETERKKENMKKWFLPRLILCMAVIYLLGYFLVYIYNLLSRG